MKKIIFKLSIIIICIIGIIFLLPKKEDSIIIINNNIKKEPIIKYNIENKIEEEKIQPTNNSSIFEFDSSILDTTMNTINTNASIKIKEKQAEFYKSLEDQGLVVDGLLQDPIIEGELKEEIESALNVDDLSDYIDPNTITDWSSGIASAYGGYGDAAIRDNQITATGAAVTETSMGVAIPMAWSNFRSYYGKKVIIEYNGKYVTATINDCGGMGNGSRHLDLQPGVFKAFGFDNCNDWGLRTVRYKIL